MGNHRAIGNNCDWYSIEGVCMTIFINPGQCEVKDQSVLRGLMLFPHHPILVDIVEWVTKTYGSVITESYRSQRHPNDLHGTIPVRATDLRSWCYPDAQAYEIRHEINKRWIYDTERPDMMCAIIHDSGQGTHFHIQIHPNTIKREL